MLQSSLSASATSPRIRLAGLLVPFLACVASAAELTPENVEFFEKRVRPVLVEHCGKCHAGDQSRGGLRVDSLSALLKGGDTGPAIVPGKPEDSILIEAVKYDPNGYQMPPTGKLADDQIAALTEWVSQGAIWPGDAGTAMVESQGIDLVERAKHWSFQPARPVAVPTADGNEWARNPIDQFILEKLTAAGLAPSEQAERRTLLRRATFDLVGLPPSPADLDAFASDTAPDAWPRAIERLLASPHYGERWGRHWLDLVRYAETGGHEFDFEIPYTWRYRDYVTRALNDDVPYDQFIREHLAGDLIKEPRRDTLTGDNESAIGTAFYWFGQGKHSPVDIRAEECDTVDNQIDVLTKTFLGLTVACARCHDHKFDAILQRDYYSLAGFLQSSRRAILDTTEESRTESIANEILSLEDEARTKILEVLVRESRKFADRVADRLVSEEAGDIAWRQTWMEAAKNNPLHPFHLWAKWSDSKDREVQIRQWKELSIRQWTRPKASQIVDGSLDLQRPYPPHFCFSCQTHRKAWRLKQDEVEQHPEENSEHRDDLPEWHFEGLAFFPAIGSEWMLGNSPERPLRGVINPGTWARSGTTSPRLRGVLRSPTFTITTPYIDYWMHRVGGTEHPGRPYKQGQVHLIVDGFQIIRNPLYGKLTINVERADQPKFYRQDVQQFLGCQAYIEIEDLDDGEIIVEQLAGSHEHPLSLAMNSLIRHVLEGGPLRNDPVPLKTAEDLAGFYQKVFSLVAGKVQEEADGKLPAIYSADGPAVAELLNLVIDQLPEDAIKELQPFAARQRELEAKLPQPSWSIGITDGTAEDENLLIRGNHKKPGEPVPREFLTALQPFTKTGRIGPEPGAAGSGRLELAECIADANNPLTARVLVNRLWQHHFGRGLVPTPDDFGKMGQPPSHPELLDWLAGEFVRSGWSIKAMHRLMLESATYQQTSRLSSAVAEERDPQNLLLHRMSVQRLEAEPVRDALLALSGRLDERMYGPSVWPHLTPFMEGRGRPGHSGPLDGDGRRSLYISVRRNFLTPMFLAFDFPTPFTTMGKRSSSNVPAQALTLMNNPLVLQQTSLWADRILSETGDPDQRIRRLYQSAFGREPTESDIAAAKEFLGAEASTSDADAWRDLAHVLVNVKEFVFIE